MDIKYGDKLLSVSNFNTLVLSDTLENDSYNIEFTLPRTDSLEILLQKPYENIFISKGNDSYEFSILLDGVSKSEKNIIIKCVGLYYSSFQQYLKSSWIKSDYNPIQSIIELLDYYDIAYNKYNLIKNKEFFDRISVIIDTVYIKEVGNSLRLIDFINEILKRCACKLIMDNKNKEVLIHNFIEDVYDEYFQEGFDEKLINPNNYKESESKEFYNNYSIAVYPDDIARLTIDYEYEVHFYEGTIYVHQDDLVLENNQAILKYDKLINGIFFPANGVGTLTGNRRKYNNNVDQKILELSQYSQNVLYGTIQQPLVEIWKDEKSSSNTSLARHTNLVGATKLGNKIVEKYYRKRQILEFQYPKEVNRIPGDYIFLRNKKYVLISQKLRFNHTVDIKLEEYI